MPPLQAPRDDCLRGWADESGIFCIPCRHSDQRLSNLDLMPACYIYEPRWMCLPEFYWWATGISETCSQFTVESIHPTLLKSPSSLHFTSDRHWKKKIKEKWAEDLKGTLHREWLRHFWNTFSCLALPCLFEGWNRVISCCINSERQIKLNNYTERDNNQQNS